MCIFWWARSWNTAASLILVSIVCGLSSTEIYTFISFFSSIVLYSFHYPSITSSWFTDQTSYQVWFVWSFFFFGWLSGICECVCLCVCALGMCTLVFMFVCVCNDNNNNDDNNQTKMEHDITQFWFINNYFVIESICVCVCVWMWPLR